MDMALESLFKHKIRFDFKVQEVDLLEPDYFVISQHYRSQDIENVKSLGLNDINDLCTIHFKPFVLYLLSKVIHEDHVIPIGRVTIKIGVFNFQKDYNEGLICYCFQNLLNSPELFFADAGTHSAPFPEHLLKKHTYFSVEVACYYPYETLRKEVKFRAKFNYRDYWRHLFSIEDYLDYMEDTNSDEEEDKDYLDYLDDTNSVEKEDKNYFDYLDDTNSVEEEDEDEEVDVETI